MSDKSDFTSNDEVDSYTHGDTMVQFKGSVAWIDGLKVMGTGKKIFRFVMTNENGRRIRFLVWEKMIPKFQPTVVEKMIISFSRLKCGNVNLDFVQAAEDVAPVELTVTEQTKVEWCSKPPKVSRVREPISIPKVYEEFGLVCFQGYIRDPFDEQSFNNNVYGSGTVTDGQHRVKVQVRSYSSATGAKFTIGAHVEVRGQVNRDKTNSFPYVQCNTMSDIKIIDSTVIPLVEVRAGFRIPNSRSPKRIRTENFEQNNDDLESKNNKKDKMDEV